MNTRLWSAVAVLLLAQQAQAAPEIIHEERSLYRNILVSEEGSMRCLMFSLRGLDGPQTCIDLAEPDRLVFLNSQMLFAGLLLHPEPERMLLLGMGGGAIPRTWSRMMPDTEQDLVELDPAVVEVAETLLGFEPTDRMHVHVGDARVFVKRQLLREVRYDYVILDAYGEEYIPPHLLTREFLEEVRSLLTEDGVLVANTHVGTGITDHESATYRAVFETVAELRVRDSGNRILVATDLPWPDTLELEAQAAALQARSRAYGVKAFTYARSLRPDFPVGAEARVLTDDHAPVNLLNERR